MLQTFAKVQLLVVRFRGHAIADAMWRWRSSIAHSPTSISRWATCVCVCCTRVLGISILDGGRVPGSVCVDVIRRWAHDHLRGRSIAQLLPAPSVCGGLGGVGVRMLGVGIAGVCICASDWLSVTDAVSRGSIGHAVCVSVHWQLITRRYTPVCLHGGHLDRTHPVAALPWCITPRGPRKIKRTKRRAVAWRCGDAGWRVKGGRAGTHGGPRQRRRGQRGR
jgi:hypothetical protein